MEKSHYNNFYKYIPLRTVKEKYPEVWKIYQTLELLHKKYETKDISLEELELYFFVQYPVLREQEVKIFKDMFVSLEDSSVSKDVLEDLLRTIKRRSVASEIALLAWDVSEGKKSFDELSSAFVKEVNDERDEVKENEVSFITDDLHELREATVARMGLRWRTDSLNKSLGSLRKGDFGFVFARPETGKTTFLASEVSYMGGQTSNPVLWFNNEEQGSKVKLRCYQAALGLTLPELFSNEKVSQERYLELTKGNIKIIDDANIYKKDVEDICKRLQPGLIIFDQIDKIKGFVDDRDDLVLGKIYQWARELAKEYCPVIGVCQSDGSGEGQRWLTMGNVANAKTSKQAEADWILGIGRSNGEGYEFVRYFNISKNKLTGDEDTIPELRHGRFEVLIRPEIARYEDI